MHYTGLKGNDRVLLYGDQDSDTILLQMIDERDMAGMETETSLIRNLSGREDFLLAAVKVSCWNDDLSPWTAPAVFGTEDFGGKAGDTLFYLERDILPYILKGRGPDRVKMYLGGYSLAALFALWASFESTSFTGIAAASPSVWFPGFTCYMKQKRFLAESVYLSLGDTEEKTKNRLMATVGKEILTAQEILKSQGIQTIMEWNPGNHFKEPEMRTAKAFAWLIQQ